MIASMISFEKNYIFVNGGQSGGKCAILSFRKSRGRCGMNKNFMRILVIVLCGIIVLGIIAMPLSMLG